MKDALFRFGHGGFALTGWGWFAFFCLLGAIDR